jgi:hypothetical protein
MTANRHFTTILSADVPQRRGQRKANQDERLDTHQAPPLALYALYPDAQPKHDVRPFIDSLVKRSG